MRLNFSGSQNPSSLSMLASSASFLLGSFLLGIAIWQPAVTAVAAADHASQSGWPASPDCAPNWNVVSSPNPFTNNYLYAVTAVSTNVGCGLRLRFSQRRTGRLSYRALGRHAMEHS